MPVSHISQHLNTRCASGNGRLEDDNTGFGSLSVFGLGREACCDKPSSCFDSIYTRKEHDCFAALVGLCIESSSS